MSFDQFFNGYRKRRQVVPEEWLNKVKVKVNKPKS